MKLTIFGKTPESKARLKKAVKDQGFVYDESNPDIVISYGGDGTLLLSEQVYPCVPKVLFRYSKICNKCHELSIDHALELLKKKKYKIVTYNKIQVKAGKNILRGVNDVVVRNILPIHAMRYTLKVNGKQLKEEFIGDGIVAATVWGSTGYYKSITGKSFKKGMGLAFNNNTKKKAPILLKENSRITLTMTRGDAHVVADNWHQILIVKEGKTVTISKARTKAKIIEF